jgi:AraC family cel operon transcriptional repressor
MENNKFKQPVKTLTALNDFEIRNVCDLNFFDIVSDYNTFHNHDFYEYFLVIEGKGVHLINGFEVPLSRNMFVSLKPSDEHSFSVLRDENMRILNLAFSSEIALPLIKMFEIGDTDIADCYDRQVHEEITEITYNNNNVFLENNSYNKSFNADKSVISDIFPSHITLSDSQSNEIVEQYHNLHIKSHPDSPAILLLKSFFSYLLSITIMNSGRERQEGNVFPDWLRQSIVGLAEKDNCALGLSYLFENTGMNQSYLCRIFRRYMNCTPTEYINSLRLKNACNLLTYTPRSIVDVCFECGFSSVSHFNHLFKKYFGISPTAYRSRSL